MRRWGILLVALVAVLVRLVPLLTGPGLLRWGRYDDGVYYAASAALLDGRVPYRDFVLLHPPLIALVLLPFTLLGRLTSDPAGLVTARLVWMLVGALTAVLAARLAGRWGTWPGLLAGLWVACSPGNSFASQSTYIEPVGDLALLGAIVLLTCDHERPRHELAAGVLLGLALTAKIWYVAPVGVLLLILLLQRRRSAVRAGVVAALVAGAILVPFFLMAPHQMWHMVVYDQLSRQGAVGATFLDRLGLAVGGRFLGFGPTTSGILAAVAGLVALVGVVRSLGDRQARLVASVAVVTVVVLLASPSSFRHYGSFSAAPVGVSLAIGWSLLGRHLPGSVVVRRGAALLALAAVICAGVLLASRPVTRSFPLAGVSAVLPPGCITSDNPIALILTDRLSSDLRAGCPVAVDVTGASYGVHKRRAENTTYLTWLTSYLRSGQAIILARHADSGLEERAVAALGTVVYQHGPVRVLRPGP